MQKPNTNSSTINLSSVYPDHNLTNILKVFPQLKNLVILPKKTDIFSSTLPVLVDKITFYQIILEKIKSYFELKETFIMSDSIGIILKDIKRIMQNSNDGFRTDRSESDKKYKLPLINRINYPSKQFLSDDAKSRTCQNFSKKSNGRKKSNNSNSPNLNKSFRFEELSEDRDKSRINYVYLDLEKTEKPKLKLVHFADLDSDFDNTKNKTYTNKAKVGIKKSNLKKPNIKKNAENAEMRNTQVVSNIRNKSNGIKLHESKSIGKIKKSSSKNLINYSLSEKNLNELYNIDDKDFEIFQFENKVGRENTLPLIGNYIFNYFNFGEIINKTKFKNWCKKISEGYNRKNPYHTDLHAADITHTNYIYFKEGLINEIMKLDNSSICAIFLSSICHDYKHPGVNNNYLMETRNNIAINYNDISVLENMHISETFKLINSDKNCNIFEKFDKNSYKKIRKQMISCVLNTDMSFHKNFLDFMNKCLKEKNLNEKPNEKDTQSYMDLIVHTADISNPTKTFDVYYKWAQLVVEEFYQQGDKEKELGLNCSCDRDKVTLYRSQLGFIDYIEKPYFDLFGKVFPKLNFLVENLNTNREKILLLEQEDKDNKNKEKKN